MREVKKRRLEIKVRWRKVKREGSRVREVKKRRLVEAGIRGEGGVV